MFCIVCGAYNRRPILRLQTMAPTLSRACCLFLLLLLPTLAQANCSTTISGESATLVINITDCERERMEIEVNVYAPGVDGGVAQPKVSLASQCRQDARGLRCRADGSTVLAGAVYRYTDDTNPTCEGRVPGRRLTCVSGCRARLPKYLYLRPYAC